jgi:hypothetical protein
VTAELDGLLAVRGGQLWVSGNWQACPFGKTCPSVPFVASRTGTRWTSERLPAGVKAVSGMSPDRSGQPQWMTVTTADLSAPYFAHYSRGSWTLVRGAAITGASNPSVAVVHIPGTDATWAVGWAPTGGSAAFSDPVMELNGSLP